MLHGAFPLDVPDKTINNCIHVYQFYWQFNFQLKKQTLKLERITSFIAIVMLLKGSVQ